MSERGEYIYGTDGNEGHWLTGEQIVRCRDCAYRHRVQTYTCFGAVDNCHLHATPVTVEPDGFCSWGKRKEDE